MRSKTKTLYVFLFISLFTISCENVDIAEKGKSSITADGILSGEIVSYTGNEIDSIKVFESNKSIVIGKAEVLANGHFSINLSIPTLKKVSDDYNSVIKYSDLTGLVGEFDSIFAFKNNKIVGYLIRNNYTNNSKDSVGLAFSHFVYSDRANTLKGEDQSLSPSNSGGYDTSYKVDFNLNKGWNEASIILTNIGMNGLNHKTTYSLSNIIPFDLNWKYIKKGYEN